MSYQQQQQQLLFKEQQQRILRRMVPFVLVLFLLLFLQRRQQQQHKYPNVVAVEAFQVNNVGSSSSSSSSIGGYYYTSVTTSTIQRRLATPPTMMVSTPPQPSSSSSLSLLRTTNCFGTTNLRNRHPRRPYHHQSGVLYSINPLLSSIEEQYAELSSSSPFNNNNNNNSNEPNKTNQPHPQQTILVGGKGGVGKTTTAAALALELVSHHHVNNNKNNDKHWNVLIVSTDPAHSLGDALDVDLSSANGQIVPIPIIGGSSSTNEDDDEQRWLYAQEINADLAFDEFQTSMETLFNSEQLASTFALSPDILDSLGINELQSLLRNPPPGLDELIALSNIFSSSSSSSTVTTGTNGNCNNNNNNIPSSFDIVIVDTAPTGHTLRLLALPQFLNGLVTKVLKFRRQLSTIAATVQTVLGSGTSGSTSNSNPPAMTMETALERIESFQYRIQQLRQLLHDGSLTKFVVVTIPTQLAVSETKRFISELQNPNNNIAVTDVIINQCVVVVENETNDNDSNNSNSNSNTVLSNYYQRRVSGQQRYIQKLDDAIRTVSQSKEYQQNVVNGGGTTTSIAMTQVPFMDVELVGIPALGYIGSQVYVNNPNFDHLLLNDSTAASSSSGDNKEPKFVICGGKGGVGKTTSSASLAVTMAVTGGHKVALISTDPAHSLGDVVQMNLAGGQLQDCPLIGIPSMNTNGEIGSLSVLEIDPTATLNQFKDVVNQLMGNSNLIDSTSDNKNNGLRDALVDLQDIFDTLPAGTDEVVALAKIVNLVKKGGFDRIVLDTAPTGHTLRMLSTPGFLADLIERLLRISDKINSNRLVQLMVLGSTTAQRREELKNAAETAKSTLLSFQFQMYDLEDLFANAQQTEFMIVTVPTELAVRESIRLLNDLTFESPDLPIKVRNVLVNQVLNGESDNDGARAFLSHIAATQMNAITELQQFIATTNNNNNNAAQQSGTNNNKIVSTQVPYLDTEPRGVYGLKALAVELTREAMATEETVVEVH